ncbi:hypothetical protein [Brevundimonas vesicularis]|uniref:hypothetical protein n=1 Tax=Brevundimonas vesicularis TaxID=41276 RepID=UPI0038D39CBD
MNRIEKATRLVARLQRALQSAENGQDQSIERLARLAQTLTRTRREAGLAATVGQPAFDALARAMNAQIEAQKAMVDLHHALAEVKSKSRFRSIHMGGLDKDDEDIIRGRARSARLQLVGRQA